MAPLALTTQAQLDQVMRAARPIPPDLRDEYLLLVARALSGCVVDEQRLSRLRGCSQTGDVERR
jgi:hypothetical protein